MTLTTEFKDTQFPAPSVWRLDDIERAHILRVYEACNHNHSKAARLLEIDRTTLYNKLRRYGVK